MRSHARKTPLVAAVIFPLLFLSCDFINSLLPDKVEENIKTASSQALRLLGSISIDPGDIFSVVNKGMMIVAQTVSSNSQTIRAFTDALGNFDLEIPDALKSNEFIISLVDASGRAIGPLLDKASQMANGVRSIGMTIGANLPSVDFGAIRVAANGFAETAAAVAGINSVPNLVARVSAAGIPVGLASHGKGSAAMTTTTSAYQVNDRDQDGLIDLIDADDDGDGILDDFDADSTASGTPEHYAADVGFWLNPSDQDYRLFYQSAASLREYVKGKYILELWFNVRDDAEAATVAGVSLDTRSMPAYVGLLKTGPDSDPSLQVPWSAIGPQGQAAYSLNETISSTPLPQGGKQWKNHLIVAAGEKADLRAGDLFNFKVMKKDGSVLIVSQMLNFVFTNIPLLREIGTDTANLTNFTSLMDAAILDPGAPVPGSGSSPLVIADDKDLTIRFQPPLDDMGQPIRQGSYRISIIPYRSSGAQVWNIDLKTWGDVAPAGGYYNNNHLMLEIPVAQLALESNGNYSVTIPKSCFPNFVYAQGETSAFVPERYSIGIVALVKESQVAFTVFVKK